MKNDNDTIQLMEAYGDIMKRIDPKDMEEVQVRVKELSELIRRMIISYRIDRGYSQQDLQRLEKIQSHMSDINTELHWG